MKREKKIVVHRSYYFVGVIVSSLLLAGFLLANSLSREYLERLRASRGGNNNNGSIFEGEVADGCHCGGSLASFGGIDF